MRHYLTHLGAVLDEVTFVEAQVAEVGRRRTLADTLPLTGTQTEVTKLLRQVSEPAERGPKSLAQPAGGRYRG